MLPAGEPSVSAAGTRHKGKREGLYPRIRYVKIQTLSLCRGRRMLRALSREGAPGDYSMPNSNVVPNSLRTDIVTRFFVRL